MNEQETHAYLAERLGIFPRLVPFFFELQQDKVILNPLLLESVPRLGRLLDLRPGRKVLDLACGRAGVSLPLVHIYKVELTGVDLLPDLIREAWARAEASGLYPQCNFTVADAAWFAAHTRRTWDVVLMLGASFIWTGLDGALQALPRLVASGGYLAVGEPYYLPQAVRRPDHPFLTKEETTRRLGVVGPVVEILDDGEAGWKAYHDPEEKVRTRLRKDHAGDAELLDFLTATEEAAWWEQEHLGWAVWILKMDG
jgi:SAM-dependent methyltransferase